MCALARTSVISTIAQIIHAQCATREQRIVGTRTMHRTRLTHTLATPCTHLLKQSVALGLGSTELRANSIARSQVNK